MNEKTTYVNDENAIYVNGKVIGESKNGFTARYMASGNINQEKLEDVISYDQCDVDALASDARIKYKDFEDWLKECLANDKVFDTVIYPYCKGNPPPNVRFANKYPEYQKLIEEAIQVFEKTLEEIINHIIDFSNDSSLMLPNEVSAGSSDMITADKYVIPTDAIQEETIVGEKAENSEVSK